MPGRNARLSNADRHRLNFDLETRAMSLRKIKSLLIRLGFFGFLFFLIKGFLWIAVLWFGVSLF